MKQRDFVELLAAKGYTKKDAKQIVDDMIGTLMECLAEGEEVHFHGFGSFSVIDLGDIDTTTIELGKVIPDMGVFAGSLRKKPGMQISVMSVEGNVTLCIAGLYSEEDEELLQTMLNRVADEVKKHALF